MKDLIERLRANGVHTLLAQFTDIHGVAKGKLVPLAPLRRAARPMASALPARRSPAPGCRASDRAPSTTPAATPAPPPPLPWMPGVARIVCDGFVNGQPFDACPRQVLKRAVARLAERGWHLRTGIEPEFFLLRRDGDRWLPADDAGPARQALLRPEARWRASSGFLHELHAALTAVRAGRAADRPRRRAWPVRAELRLRRGAGQRRPPDAVQAGGAGAGRGAWHGVLDDAQALRRPAGQRHAFPRVAVVGLEPEAARQRAQRVRAAPQRRQRRPRGTLSPIGRHFIAGVLAHSAALTALAAPTVNSYKRLRVGEIAVRHQLGAGLRGAGPEQPHRARCARCTAASSGACPIPAPTPTWRLPR